MQYQKDKKKIKSAKEFLNCFKFPSFNDFIDGTRITFKQPSSHFYFFFVHEELFFRINLLRDTKMCRIMRIKRKKILARVESLPCLR